MLLLQMSVVGIVSIIFIELLLIGGIVAFFLIYPIKVWWRALISDAYIPLNKLLAMKMRKVNLNNVVVAVICLRGSRVRQRKQT